MAAVLYVDDEPSLRRLVRRWYERRGITVRVAANIAEAREILMEEEIAGVFIDVWLGRETGFDLYAWIVGFRPRLKDRVVFITGDVAPGADSGEFQALGRTVIAKPFELEELDVHIRQWVGAGGPESARVAPEGPGARS